MDRQFEKIAISEISAAGRMIPVHDDQAVLLKASIEADGLLEPIVVRRVPNGKKKVMLVAGARRLKACTLLGWKEIDCHIVQADKDEARMLEASENIFRNDLSVLDRAVSVLGYREAWENLNGKVKRGGDQRAKLAFWSDDLGFNPYLANRMGISETAVKRLVRIAQTLPKALQNQVRGTPIADNQSQLLALCSLDSEALSKAAEALKLCGNDFEKAMEALMVAKPKPDFFQKHHGAVVSNASALSVEDRKRSFQQLYKMFGEELEWARANPLTDQETVTV